MNRWRRFRKLPRPERRMLLAALVELPMSGLALRILGFRRLQSLLSRLARRPRKNENATTPAVLPEAQTAARMVETASREGFYQANCLEQSLTLWWLLHHRKIAGQLRIGVRKLNEKFEAHAWVELDGIVLNDDADVHDHYSSFTRDITSLHVQTQ